MKRVLCLAAVLLLVASVALADHVGLYADDAGEDWCMLPGFYGGTGAAIIQKFSTGTYGSRWSLQLPEGSSYFDFLSSYSTTGSVTSDFSVATGECLDGDILLGHLIASLTIGTAWVVPAQTQTDILWFDCEGTGHPGTGGATYIWLGGSCINATESSTWGRVKALYR